MGQLLQQFLKFAVVGVIATLIDFIVLYLLYQFMGMNYLIATAIAFVIATVYNYWASMTFIFKSKYAEGQKAQEFSLFLILSIIGLILTQLLMVVFVERGQLPVMISKIFVSAFVMVFNFMSRKYFLDTDPVKLDEELDSSNDTQGIKEEN